MKILILGNDTLLGRAMEETWSEHDVVGLPSDAIAITRPLEISRTIVLYRPHVVVNCIERSDVAWCEQHPDEANLLNGTAVGYIAKACEAQRLILVQMSIPLNPEQTTTVYEQSKRHGEEQAQLQCHRLYIVRSSSQDEAVAVSLFTKKLLAQHAPYGPVTFSAQST